MKKKIFILLLFSFLLLSACNEGSNPVDSSNNAGNIPSSGPVSEEGKGPTGQQIVLPTGANGSEQSSVQTQPPTDADPTDPPTEPPANELDDGIEVPEIPQ